MHPPHTRSARRSLICLLALPALLLGTIGPARAGEWAIGFGAVISPDPYVGGDAAEIAPIPFISYQGQRLSVEPDSVQYEFSLTRNLTVSPMASIRFQRVDPADNSALVGLERRKSGIDLGASFDWATSIGLVSGEIVADATGRSDGVEAGIGYSLPAFGGRRWELTPSVGVHWSSRKLVDYYYGVRQNEAAASRFSAYSGDDAWGFDVGLNAAVDLGKRRVLVAGLSYSRAGDAVSDSPIVEDDFEWGGLVGIVWRLGRSGNP